MSHRSLRVAAASYLLSLLSFLPVCANAQTPAPGRSAFNEGVAGGLVLNLPLREGAGPIAADTSGFGNDCTLQTAPGRTPAWVANGLSFDAGQGCDLPPSANSIQTWCFAFYAAPVPPARDLSSNFNGLLFSNSGSTGLNLLTQYAGSQTGAFYADIYAPTIFSSSEIPARPSYGYGVTTGNQTFVATNRLCYVVGTPGVSLDHIYLNGVEEPYAVQNASAGLQTSSFLSIGSANTSAWSAAGSSQILYHVMGFSSALTAADIQPVNQYLLSDLQDRGAPLAPTIVSATHAQLIFDGDSITAGYGLADPGSVWRSHLALTNQPAYDQQLYAVSGATALALGASEPYRVAEQCTKTHGPAAVTVWDGTNDLMFFSFAGPTVAAQNVLNQVQAISAAGCHVLLFTMISRAGNAGDGGNFDTERETFNQILRTSGKAAGAVGIVDIATQPYLGATGANANPAFPCFQSGGTHPADACQPYIAQVVGNSMNFYSGSTMAKPTIYTAGEALLSADRVVDATGCTAACHFILPDGTGPSGEVYTIRTGTAPTTVQGQTLYGYTQTVNGQTGPVPLPAKSTVALQIVPLAQASSGVAWVIQ